MAIMFGIAILTIWQQGKHTINNHTFLGTWCDNQTQEVWDFARYTLSWYDLKEDQNYEKGLKLLKSSQKYRVSEVKEV